jgi:hypothetical protein
MAIVSGSYLLLVSLAVSGRREPPPTLDEAQSFFGLPVVAPVALPVAVVPPGLAAPVAADPARAAVTTCGLTVPPDIM